MEEKGLVKVGKKDKSKGRGMARTRAPNPRILCPETYIVDRRRGEGEEVMY